MNLIPFIVLLQTHVPYFLSPLYIPTYYYRSLLTVTTLALSATSFHGVCLRSSLEKS
jgi:hypothetical protein